MFDILFILYVIILMQYLEKEDLFKNFIEYCVFFLIQLYLKILFAINLNKPCFMAGIHDIT